MGNKSSSLRSGVLQAARAGKGAGNSQDLLQAVEHAEKLRAEALASRAVVPTELGDKRIGQSAAKLIGGVKETLLDTRGDPESVKGWRRRSPEEKRTMEEARLSTSAVRAFVASNGQTLTEAVSAADRQALHDVLLHCSLPSTKQ